MAYYNKQETEKRVQKVVKLLNDKDIDVAIIYFDEIVSCDLVDKKLIISIKDSRAKTLYLNAFSKKQRNIIHREINTIINKIV